MDVGLVNGFSGITNGAGALTGARINSDDSKFSDLINKIQAREKSTLSSSQVVQDGKLNGDYSTGFSGSFSRAADKNAKPSGAAANQANGHVKSKTIDKSSKLYEKSMELESYFVKQMLSEMRKTVNKSALGGSDFAGEMYNDMLFDEYAASMTKNAGFGLADQIYLSLV